MKYLFFDIECANCFEGIGKICEFGYVLIDEQLNILEKKHYIINPNAEFDWYVAKNLLAYKKEVYTKADEYEYYFPNIQPLFTDINIHIFGYSVKHDMQYLNDEAKRYTLPFFNCQFYDVHTICNTFIDEPIAKKGVKNMCTALDVEPPAHEHKSVDDAFATMQIVKAICQRTGLSIPELIRNCEECKGQTCEGKITTVLDERKKVERLKKANNAEN